MNKALLEMKEMTQKPATSKAIHIGEAINRSLEIAEKDQAGVFGIPSGYPSLDRITKGWGAGELIVIGARPCVGKTTLALGMARNAAVEFGVPTAYCTLESTTLELTDRLIVSESGIKMIQLEGRSRMDDDDWFHLEASLAKLVKAPLYFADTPAKAPGEYRMGEFQVQAEALVNEKGVRLVFVDNLQEATPGWARFAPECLAHECGKNLRFLKEMAARTGLTIVVLTLIERPEKWRGAGPTLPDLGDYCPCAEEYADKIILLHRPSLFSFDINENEWEPLHLRVVQNRNGRIGQADLLFDRERLSVHEPMEGIEVGNE